VRLSLLATAVFLAFTSPALAHRLHVDVKPTGDRVRVEAYYDDGTPAQEARVTITRGDETVAEGRTDE
jgi:hypothetical protein